MTPKPITNINKQTMLKFFVARIINVAEVWRIIPNAKPYLLPNLSPILVIDIEPKTMPARKHAPTKPIFIELSQKRSN